jgi:hypothetical protein
MKHLMFLLCSVKLWQRAGGVSGGGSLDDVANTDSSAGAGVGSSRACSLRGPSDLICGRGHGVGT